MKIISHVILIIFLFLGISCSKKVKTSMDLVKSAESQIKSLSSSNIKKRLKKEKFIIIDVRSKEEFEKGHITGAINIPRGILEFEIEKKVPIKQSNILVYCQVGGRSALAVKRLLEMGYMNTINLKDGYILWDE